MASAPLGLYLLVSQQPWAHVVIVGFKFFACYLRRLMCHVPWWYYIMHLIYMPTPSDPWHIYWVAHVILVAFIVLNTQQQK